MLLAGDIGGTHTRLALFDQGKLVGKEEIFASRDHKNLAEIVQQFLLSVKKDVDTACFGVAGPVHEGVCKATNLPWVIDAAQLSKALQIQSVFLLNDLEANAWGIQALQKGELAVLHDGKRQTGNRALIAAGTGLGEAGLYWDGKKHHPFACEGGHTDFGPRNALEAELFLYLQKKFGHVSYERVVSGPGLYSLFLFLVDSGREVWAEEVKEQMKRGDPAKVVSEYGREERDPACTRAVDWFISLYGAEAGNLALKFLSLGGFYIGGGIAPQLMERMKQGGFHAAFIDKGRFRDLLASIPIWVITNDNAALLGAAYYAENR